MAKGLVLLAAAAAITETPHFHTPTFYEGVLANPVFLVSVGVTVGVGFVVVVITAFLFRFLRKKIAQEIIGEPAPGGPDDKHTLLKCPWPCQAHAAVIAGLKAQGIELDDVEARQKVLREETLPEKYLRVKDLEGCRAEHDKCQGDRKQNEANLFGRVSKLEQKVGMPLNNTVPKGGP
jgi:hypothetical protein